MTKLLRQPLVTAAMTCLCVAIGFGDSDGNALSTKLNGFKEVPPINSQGSGQFQATINTNAGQITYVLTYSGLTSNATQSHVHFAEAGVNGGVMFFLCTNLGNGPAGTPACPASGGTVTGVITAANILSVPGQNVTAGDFASALKIIRSGVGYANVHTVNFPAGEIRGQVKGDD